MVQRNLVSHVIFTITLIIHILAAVFPTDIVLSSTDTESITNLPSRRKRRGTAIQSKYIIISRSEFNLIGMQWILLLVVLVTFFHSYLEVLYYVAIA